MLLKRVVASMKIFDVVHMREIIDLITLTWNAKKYDYIINMHHGASKEKES
jgi:hypothetical protein